MLTRGHHAPGKNMMTKINPFETPVWAVYGSNDDTQVICAPLPRYNEKSTLPSRMWSDGGLWTSRSRWYETEAQLIEGEGLMPACSECGRPFSTKNWHKPLPEQLIERNLCFSCNHYLHTVIPIYGTLGHVVIGCTTYSWNPLRPMVEITNDGQFYGHGGRKFLIRLLFTGEEVETNNLWCGGQIPERFLDRMPDNAVFVRIPEPIGHGQGYLG